MDTSVFVFFLPAGGAPSFNGVLAFARASKRRKIMVLPVRCFKLYLRTGTWWISGYVERTSNSVLYTLCVASELVLSVNWVVKFSAI